MLLTTVEKVVQLRANASIYQSWCSPESPPTPPMHSGLVLARIIIIVANSEVKQRKDRHALKKTMPNDARNVQWRYLMTMLSTEHLFLRRTWFALFSYILPQPNHFRIGVFLRSVCTVFSRYWISEGASVFDFSRAVLPFSLSLSSCLSLQSFSLPLSLPWSSFSNGMRMVRLPTPSKIFFVVDRRALGVFRLSERI